MARIKLISALTGLMLVAACSIDDRTGERVTTGAAVGAVSGAAVGLLTGNAIWRSVTGVVAGAAGGLVVDQINKAQENDKK